MKRQRESYDPCYSHPFLFLASHDLFVIMPMQNGLAWHTLWLTWILLLREMGTDLGWAHIPVFSPTRWAWVWASSGRWWRTGKPGALQSTGHSESDTTERLNIVSFLSLACREISNNVSEPQFSPLLNGVAQLMWVITRRITQFSQSAAGEPGATCVLEKEISPEIMSFTIYLKRLSPGPFSFTGNSLCISD